MPQSGRRPQHQKQTSSEADLAPSHLGRVCLALKADKIAASANCADLRCLRCGWPFIEQGLRVGQVRRTAPCIEEPIDVQEAVMRLRMPTLIEQDTGKARCRAQFERS